MTVWTNENACGCFLTYLQSAALAEEHTPRELECTICDQMLVSRHLHWLLFSGLPQQQSKATSGGGLGSSVPASLAELVTIFASMSCRGRSGD